jgi:hypothetical protein
VNVATPHHPNFIPNMERGEAMEDRVALVLLDEGLTVKRGTRTRARFREEAHKHTNCDLFVTPWRLYVEVCGSSYSFTSPDDWPFAYGAYVKPVTRWDRTDIPKPWAVVYYSEPTGGIVAIRPSTRAEWTVRSYEDHNTDQGIIPCYTCPRHLLTSREHLIGWLRRLENGGA